MPNQTGALFGAATWLQEHIPNAPRELVIHLDGGNPIYGSSDPDVSLFAYEGIDIDGLATIALQFGPSHLWNFELHTAGLEAGDHSVHYVANVTVFLTDHEITGPDLAARMVAIEKQSAR